MDFMSNEHSDNIAAPGNVGDGSGDDEVVKCDVINHLDTASEANNREFSFGGYSF